MATDRFGRERNDFGDFISTKYGDFLQAVSEKAIELDITQDIQANSDFLSVAIAGALYIAKGLDLPYEHFMKIVGEMAKNAELRRQE